VCEEAAGPSFFPSAQKRIPGSLFDVDNDRRLTRLRNDRDDHDDHDEENSDVANVAAVVIVASVVTVAFEQSRSKPQNGYLGNWKVSG
jgi:hypothetical protein